MPHTPWSIFDITNQIILLVYFSARVKGYRPVDRYAVILRSRPYGPDDWKGLRAGIIIL